MTFDPDAAPPPEMDTMPETLAKGATGMTNLQRIKRIEMVIESVRPQLQMDKGDVELVDVMGDTVYVNMTGACNGCQLASQTLGGIQQRLMEDIGGFIKVLPASELPKAAAGA